MKLIYILFVSAASVCAIDFRKALNLNPSRMLLSTNSTEFEDQYRSDKIDNAIAFTTGYMRTDAYDWVNGIWTQAQVLPIGVCFQQGFNGGSANLARVTISEFKVVRRTHLYASSDCSGVELDQIPFVQPRIETTGQLERRISHVSDFGDGVRIPGSNSGMIVR